MRLQKVVTGFAVCAAWGLALGTSAYAAGFSLIEQSVSGLGTAYSGGAAVAEDPSTVFFNPAGMTRLAGTQVAAGLHYIMPKSEFSKSSAANAIGSPISGGDGGQGGVNKLAPNFYLVRNFENFAVGLGVNVPFGLATSYDKSWVGRYHAVDSEVKTVNINPAIAFKASDKLSVGVGVSAQYLEANLTNMVDFGLATYSAHRVAALTSNSNMDIYGDMNADSWAYGFNLGALYQYSDGGRLGLVYRSRIKHDLEGDADFKIRNPAFINAVNPAFLAAANAYFPDQDISGKLTLPASASISLYQEINPKLAVSADVTWTEWSTFDELVIEFDRGVGAGGVTKESVTTEKWEDNWRYSLGATYKASDVMTVRAGVAYDESPVGNDRYRTPRIPDNDRFWVAAGLGYALSDKVAVNIGYVHLFVDDSKSDKTASGEDASRGTLQGTYAASVDIASVEVVMKF